MGLRENHEEHEGHEVDFDNLSKQVIGCALEVHKTLGPGLLESAYEHCLAYELQKHDIGFRSQHPIPIDYKGEKLDCGFRADLLIEGQLIVELKAVERLLGVHEAQVLTYMKLAGASIGLLMNFNVPMLRNGLRRFVIWQPFVNFVPFVFVLQFCGLSTPSVAVFGFVSAFHASQKHQQTGPKGK